MNNLKNTENLFMSPELADQIDLSQFDEEEIINSVSNLSVLIEFDTSIVSCSFLKFSWNSTSLELHCYIGKEHLQNIFEENINKIQILDNKLELFSAEPKKKILRTLERVEDKFLLIIKTA